MRERRRLDDSVYGKGAAHRKKVLTNMPILAAARDNAQKEYERITADPASSQAAKDAAYANWVAMYDAWKANHDLYVALPEEADAWQVGASVTSKYSAP